MKVEKQKVFRQLIQLIDTIHYTKFILLHRIVYQLYLLITQRTQQKNTSRFKGGYKYVITRYFIVQ